MTPPMLSTFQITPYGPASGGTGAWSPQKSRGQAPAAPSIIGGPAASAILHAAPTNAILGGPAGTAIMRGAAVDVSA
jgi:hypothetical protein